MDSRARRAVSWEDDALCAEVATDMFFPDKAGGNAANARTICRVCPVAAQCLELGMQFDSGIFGGKSPEERRQLRRTA